MNAVLNIEIMWAVKTRAGLKKKNSTASTPNFRLIGLVRAPSYIRNLNMSPAFERRQHGTAQQRRSRIRPTVFVAPRGHFRPYAAARSSQTQTVCAGL